jgi:hypothetical protein
MWQFARLQEGPYDPDPRTVNIAIPDMQFFSLVQTTENKAEMGMVDRSHPNIELLNTFALRLTTSPISVPVPISVC